VSAAQDQWFELAFPWDKAADVFGREAVQHMRFTNWNYIIQRR
jgi:hypothetical protein